MRAAAAQALRASACVCGEPSVQAARRAVVYDVPLTAETIRPVKGRVFCLPLLPTARLDLQPMVEIKRALLRGTLRLDWARALRRLPE